MRTYLHKSIFKIEKTPDKYRAKSRISVILVEDHAIVREGLRSLLSIDPDIDVVGEADNGRVAIQLVGSLKPSLVLMDLSMPGMNGMDAIREIKKRYPDVKVVVITAHKAEEYVRFSLQAGASGYLLKDATYAELTTSINKVMEGKVYLSQGLADKLVIGHSDSGVVDARSPWEALTHRERIVLKLIAEGQHNKNIANYLCISVKTVEKHRSNLMKKLDLHNTAAVTAFAIERQLVSPWI